MPLSNVLYVDYGLFDNSPQHQLDLGHLEHSIWHRPDIDGIVHAVETSGERVMVVFASEAHKLKFRDIFAHYCSDPQVELERLLRERAHNSWIEHCCQAVKKWCLAVTG